MNANQTADSPQAADLAGLQQEIKALEQQLAAEKAQRIFAEQLLQVGVVLNSSLNYETVLDCILEQIESLVPHDAACILLLEDQQVRPARWHGYAKFGVGSFPSSSSIDVAEKSAFRQA